MSTTEVVEETALADAPIEAPILRVSTKYMETFQPVEFITGGSDLSTILNHTGQLDIYSQGTNFEVYRFRPVDGEYGSYQVEDLGIRAQQLSVYEPLTGPTDNPHIFGIDAQGKTTLSVYDTLKKAYVQKVTQPPSAGVGTWQALAVKGASNVYVNVVLADGRLASSFYNAEGKWGSPDWVSIKDTAGKPVKVKSMAMCANKPVQSSLFAISDSDDVLFAEENFNVSVAKSLGKKARHLAVVVDAGNLLQIFAIDTSGFLWLKRQKKYSTGTGIQFEAWEQLDNTTPLARVSATLRFDGLLEVYAVGANGRLYRTYQSIQNKKAVWAPLFQLGNAIDLSTFTVGRDRKGFAQVYTTTHDNRLVRFLQAEDTLQWLTEEIRQPNVAKAISVPTHSVEITVLDETGIPQPSVDVRVNSSYLVNLRINGKSYLSSPVDTVSCQTDTAGKVVIHQQATALTGATLFVETPFSIAGSPLIVQPNQELQAKLQTLTGDQVYNAKDRSGAYILPTEFRTEANAESMAEITRSSMALGTPATGAPSAVVYHYRSGFRGRPAASHTIDVTQLNAQSWSVDFQNGFPQYSPVSQDDMAAWHAENVQGSFLGIDWGDVWNAIKQGVEWVVNGLKRIIVEIDKALNEVKVFFELVVDGVKQVFQTVLKFVQQAFDFVEGVWNYIKVKLEQLYQWLAFLFDFADFRRTAEAVTHTWNQVLDFTGLAVQYVENQILNGIDNLKSSLDTAVNEYIKTLLGQPTLGNYGEQYKEPVNQVEYASDHNLLLNSFTENRSQDTAEMEARMQAIADGPIADIATKLQEVANNFEFGDGKKAFEDALGYFTNVGGDVNQSLNLVLSGTIKVFEAVALFALDVAKGVIKTIMDAIVDVIQAFKDLLNQDWEIPIVSQVFEFFTGESLTFRPITLISYIIAIPSTILYKAIRGEAPFTDASLQEFKNHFTASWIAQEAGLAPLPAEEDRLMMPQAVADTMNTVFRYLFGGVVFIRAVTDAMQAAINSLEKTSWPALNVVCVGLRFLTTGFTTPWALNAQAGPLTCPAGSKGFSSVIWLCQLICGPVRGGVIAFAAWKIKSFKDYAKLTGEITLSLWGVAHVIMDGVHYAMQPDSERDPKAIASKTALNVPGQALRFLALDKLNNPEDFYIPVGVLVTLILVGYSASIALNLPDSKAMPGLVLHPA